MPTETKVVFGNIEPPDVFADDLTFQSASSTLGAVDPSGYAEWHNGQKSEPTSTLDRLMLKHGNAANPDLFGIDVSHDGGLTYHHDLAQAQHANFAAVNQGDE